MRFHYDENFLIFLDFVTLTYVPLVILQNP